jgi:hypothetical protein
MKSADDLLSEEDAKNAPREVMRLVNRMMSSDGVDVVSDSFPRYSESCSNTDFLSFVRCQHHLFTTRGDPKVVEIIREV